MEWTKIKDTIVQYLTNNPEGELKKPNIRLRELQKIESKLPKEYISDPKRLLDVDKQEVILLLGINNSAGKSIINNIYDILNDITLKARSRKNL